MSIGSTKILSMNAAIARGAKKADSHLVTDDETSAMWDKLEAEHKKLLAAHPGKFIDIPNDPDIC